MLRGPNVYAGPQDQIWNRFSNVLKNAILSNADGAQFGQIPGTGKRTFKKEQPLAEYCRVPLASALSERCQRRRVEGSQRRNVRDGLKLGVRKRFNERLALVALEQNGYFPFRLCGCLQMRPELFFTRLTDSHR